MTCRYSESDIAKRPEHEQIMVSDYVWTRVFVLIGRSSMLASEHDFSSSCRPTYRVCALQIMLV